jgi:hypothetical protein
MPAQKLNTKQTESDDYPKAVGQQYLVLERQSEHTQCFFKTGIHSTPDRYGALDGVRNIPLAFRGASNTVS